MPKSNLTQLAVERIKPPTDSSVTLWDKTLPGFGVRVTSKGRKTWLVLYRVNGRSVMETLGTLATVPKLTDARDRARASMLKARSGVHPVEERHAAAAGVEAEKAAAAAAVKEAEEGRFEAVFQRFMTEYVGPKCSDSYVTDITRMFRRNLLPVWGDRQITSITKADINAVLNAKAATRLGGHKRAGGAAIMANRMHARLRTLFRWCIANDLCEKDPSVGVQKRGKEQSRDRFLSEQEIVWFWHGAEAAGWPYAPILRLLLLTGQRKGEVAGMRWSEIDQVSKTWVIPRERTKSSREHVVHLSDLAVAIIEAVPRISGDLIFPSYVQGGRLDFVRPKIRLDRAMLAQKRAATGDENAEIRPFVIHDLRRTCATTMNEKLKIASHVADRILNHSGRAAGTVAAVYNRTEYLDERQAALEAFGRYVEALVALRADNNVVAMRA